MEMEKNRKYITTEELRLHNKPDDLWISIQGKAYNVTDWVKDHPGGAEPLMNLAGQDVTDAFIAYHPGTAWAYLDKLFTGYYVRDFKVSDVSRDYRKLYSEFLKMGLFEKKGHVQLYNMASVAVMLGMVVYGVVRSESSLVHMGCGFLLGLLWIVAAYMGHDSGHYVVMKSEFWNSVTQILAGNCVTGISIAWWKWTHNAHHIACNSLDYDPDLQHVPVFAVSTKFFHSLTSVFYGRELTFDGVARFLIGYQHFTYYPVMIFGRINLFIQTFLLLFSKRPVPNRLKNIFGILVFWTWFPLLVSCLPNWGERVMFVLIAFAVTALQHVQFTLNHFSGDTYVGPPKGNDWFEKQTAGTIDISCSSYMDWLFGGLQFQLEHHLFPRLPRCQLRKVSPIIQELCKKHSLPYRSLSFWEANVSTIRTLRTAALQARDLTNPVPKNLVWEALNTHG
ncbi:PREDICTED: delta(8)-fatty-acid desaturase-like [Fragaria vesca subsp. vesca]|uniref:delta(8)-fatty-acid desaturase 1-like n=1 Tax=Fragaria vesca subsp. vesca TaxID=101020 RepID=UPI0002C36E27|nr:PREDICTED: delta(8)-fatty-acid desaturase 1-like [Fragaria vesca subsp. vesca]